VQHLGLLLHPATNKQVNDLALLTFGLAHSRDCHLANIATVLPIEGQRENLIQRLRRILKEDRLQRRRVYGRLVQHMFAHWTGREITLVMDRTDLENRMSVLMIGAAYGKRALPLVWEVLEYGGTSAQLQVKLLKQVASWIPKRVRVILLGDAEFRAVAVQKLCKLYKWHWQVGLKSDIGFREVGETWQALRQWEISPGQRLYRQQVYLTAKHNFGPVNLMADWPLKEDYPRYVALDQPANRLAWRRGRKRQWIENLFRDWKSYGFGLEDSHLDDLHRMDALLLGMSLADLWLMHLGRWLTISGQRTVLEARHKHDYSLFRLGRDYVQRAQTMNWKVPIGFTLSH